MQNEIIIPVFSVDIMNDVCNEHIEEFEKRLAKESLACLEKIYQVDLNKAKELLANDIENELKNPKEDSEDRLAAYQSMYNIVIAFQKEHDIIPIPALEDPTINSDSLTLSMLYAWDKNGELSQAALKKQELQKKTNDKSRN